MFASHYSRTTSFSFVCDCSRSKHPVQSWEVKYVDYPSGVLGKDVPILERHAGTAILTTPGCLHLEMSCDAGYYGSRLVATKQDSS